MVSREAKSPIDSLLLFLIHPVAAQHRKSPFIDIILEHGSVGTYSGGPTAIINTPPLVCVSVCFFPMCVHVIGYETTSTSQKKFQLFPPNLRL